MEVSLPQDHRTVSYDSGKVALQWRCALHVTTKPDTLCSLIAASFILPLCAPELSTFGAATLLGGLTIGVIGTTSWLRGRKPRQCCTTISALGIVDKTPSRTTTMPWARVRSMEIFNGDIYFSTRIGVIFVPKTAFASAADGIEFFHSATNYKAQADAHIIHPALERLSPQPEESVPHVDYEEAKWIELEKRHHESIKDKLTDDKPVEKD